MCFKQMYLTCLENSMQYKKVCVIKKIDLHSSSSTSIARSSPRSQAESNFYSPSPTSIAFSGLSLTSTTQVKSHSVGVHGARTIKKLQEQASYATPTINTPSRYEEKLCARVFIWNRFLPAVCSKPCMHARTH